MKLKRLFIDKSPGVAAVSATTRMTFSVRLTKHQLIALAIGLVFLLAAVSLGWWWPASRRPLPRVAVPSASVAQGVDSPAVAIRALDGVPVNPAAARLRPWAVMIDNHVDARPQAGLEHAAVVYEAVAEGGVTRLLAVFDPTVDVLRIGPVRSARPYYAAWAAEYGALYVHSGGSPEALDSLDRLDLVNVEEISASGIYFWRDLKRAAPHNLYTSADRLRQFSANRDISTAAEFSAWLRKDDAPLAERPDSGRAVKIKFSTPAFAVTYRYDRATNRYARWQGAAPHLTADGAELTASTVVVQHVRAVVTDGEGRREVGTQRGGAAEVYTDGVAHPARWQVRDRRTLWLSDDGTPLALNAGPTWIEVVDDTAVIEVAQ